VVRPIFEASLYFRAVAHSLCEYSLKCRPSKLTPAVQRQTLRDPTATWRHIGARWPYFSTISRVCIEPNDYLNGRTIRLDLLILEHWDHPIEAQHVLERHRTLISLQFISKLNKLGRCFLIFYVFFLVLQNVILS
jgi:hypothetical protein